MRSSAAAEAGAGHVAAADVHTAPTNMHSTAGMWGAAEVGASPDMAATTDMRRSADMRCSSAVTSAAVLRWRRGSAAGQNHQQSKSDKHAELCHGN
jgi:hypothetical protein